MDAPLRWFTRVWLLHVWFLDLAMATELKQVYVGGATRENLRRHLRTTVEKMRDSASKGSNERPAILLPVKRARSRDALFVDSVVALR